METSSTKEKASANGVSICLENVKYTVKPKKETLVILDNVSACFQPGHMTALMGPSGSGKTTLMDVIACRKNTGSVEGKILFGGRTLPASTLRDSVGYVEQFDTLVGELTVKQMLMYTAALRLPTTFTAAEQAQRVDEVLTQLSLTSCAHTVIGNALKRGISGGQAKRVNIALAMIRRPAVIFLDEPTSGLDSHMANDVARTLSALAAEGRTIVCTIHSPTSYAFSLFGSLLMLKKGQVLYDGPVTSVASYLQETCAIPPPVGIYYSLPEWLVDVTSDGATATPAASANKDWVALYANSALCATASKERAAASAAADDASASALTAPKSMPGALGQLSTLLRYRMVTHYKSGEFLGPRIGDKIFSGLVMLLLYLGIGDEEDTQSIASTSALLYFVAALCGYGAAAFVPSLALDRPLFYRELADGCYSAPIYYAHKFIEESLMCVFTSLLFSVIVFFGVQLQGSFFVFAAVYYLTTMTGIVLAYAVTAMVPSVEAASAILPTLVTLWMYFGGLFLLFDKMPDYLYWASWTSFLRYSWGALMLNQYSDSSLGRYGAFFDEESNQVLTVLDFYGIEGDLMGSMGFCIALLATCTLFFATCGAGLLTSLRHVER